MNLIIYVDYDLLMFFQQDKAEVTEIKGVDAKQFLYFFFDKYSNTIKNSKNYKLFCLEEKQDFYDDIFANIRQKSTFMFGEKNLDYSFFIQNLFEKLLPNYEQIKLIYSAKLEKNTLDLVENIIKQSGANSLVCNCLAEYAVKKYLLENIQQSAKNVCVVESFSDKIYFSKVTINNNVLEIVAQKELKQKSFAPRKYALAKKITEDVCRIYKPEQVEQQLDRNVEYVYLRLKDEYEKIFEQPKEYVSISAKLLDSDQRFVVKIQPSELDVLSEMYAKEIAEELSENIGDVEKIIFVGDIFDNDLVKNRLAIVEKDKLFYKMSEVLAVMDKEVVSEDEYATAFMAVDDIDEENKYEEVKLLKISELKIGNVVKLTNYDSRKGKGYATQILEFVGENKFVVVDSTRSLKAGDLLEVNIDVWHAGIELIFDVFRGNKKYGRFKTREIQVIEIVEEIF